MNKLVLLISICAFNLQIVNATSKNITRAIYFNKNYPSKDLRYIKTVKKILNTKGYNLVQLDLKNKKFKKGDLYLTFQKTLRGSTIYPPCEVKIKIMSIVKQFINYNDDKIYFESSFKRAHPRLTRDGFSRCNMAVRDTLSSLKENIIDQ
ncbi:MAG: hypothetical protein HOJ35_05180 [Bdellovibrionales bacterium]|nr:hypothetical protein [Bdellovibrionales bacterium]